MTDSLPGRVKDSQRNGAEKDRRAFSHRRLRALRSSISRRLSSAKTIDVAAERGGTSVNCGEQAVGPS
jgi:hypothetical protein